LTKRQGKAKAVYIEEERSAANNNEFIRSRTELPEGKAIDATFFRERKKKTETMQNWERTGSQRPLSGKNQLQVEPKKKRRRNGERQTKLEIRRRDRNPPKLGVGGHDDSGSKCPTEKIVGSQERPGGVQLWGAGPENTS